MKITISESQYDLIIELYQKKNDPIAEHIRFLLKKLYSPDNWGRILDPDNNCETNYGVINVYPHLEGKDNWSILNRFDSNNKVRDRMKELFIQENPDTEISTNNFIDWITYNSERLFKGELTQELIDINKDTIEKGFKNEDYAIKVIQDFFGQTAKVIRFCSGDIRDTKKGMDILVDVGGKKIVVQVKPFEKIESFIDVNGDTFYEVTSYLDPTKYSQKNVQVFFFVDYEKQKHISFENKKYSIRKWSYNKIRFYEDWLMTNISFKNSDTKIKKYRNSPIEDTLFKVGERRLQNLEFRKKEIEKLIELEKEKLKNTNK